jgi:multiphosphoryl transfer protein
LRAALRVQPTGRVQLLLPMITELEEIESVRRIVRELAGELALPMPVIGIMIETPAAAVTSTTLVDAVDFVSIGTNDLTQYTLAMDRGHPQLAARSSALQPAVLKLIAVAAEAGVAAGKPVAVCGGAAADPLAVPLLLGFGVRELSVVPTAVPAIKAQIRRLRLEQCRVLARECLDLSSADQVRVRVSGRLAQWSAAP